MSADPKECPAVEDNSSTCTAKAAILVVDDDPAVGTVLRKRLEECNYEVHTADSGESALALLQEQHVDLALLDVMMHDMDGFAVCEAIKKKTDMPVIFLTGASDEIMNQHMTKMVEAVGGIWFLSKPFDHRLLVKLIEDALNG